LYLSISRDENYVFSSLVASLLLVCSLSLSRVWMSLVLLTKNRLLCYFLYRPDAFTSRSRPRAAPLTPRPRGTLHVGGMSKTAEG